ncbi:MAG: c-type cytochrome [Alphaproteobacteria bacterium]
MTIPKSLLFVALLLVLAGAGWAFWPRPSENTGDQASRAMVEVKLPASFSAREKQGKALFDESCAVCHGGSAAGSDSGPPLVHKIYEPGHHGDAAFVLAAARGVRAHHWRFGDMPAQEGVNRASAEVIVSYVRALQRANGIR